MEWKVILNWIVNKNIERETVRRVYFGFEVLRAVVMELWLLWYNVV
jgi:hypothetical protein